LKTFSAFVLTKLFLHTEVSKLLYNILHVGAMMIYKAVRESLNFCDDFISELTRKRGNYECIATWGRPTPRQFFSAFITTPHQVWRRRTYPLPCYRLSTFAADTILYAIILTFDPATLIFDLWPWTFAVYRLWCEESLYQIWSDRAIRGGVTAISIFDLMTLNMCYMLRSPLG